MGDQGEDPDCSNHDCDQLVHLSCGLPFPHVRHQRSHRCGFHSDWLLRVRHHFQVRRWPCDLSDHLCQVQQGGSLELKQAAFLLLTGMTLMRVMTLITDADSRQPLKTIKALYF